MVKGRSHEYGCPYKGLKFAHYLKKDTITKTEYLYFKRIKVKKDGKILKLEHERSLVEKIMLKYNASIMY